MKLSENQLINLCKLAVNEIGEGFGITEVNHNSRYLYTDYVESNEKIISFSLFVSDHFYTFLISTYQILVPRVWHQSFSFKEIAIFLQLLIDNNWNLSL